MKVLIIPDVHGKDKFSHILNDDINNIDKIIFMGDYFDSFDTPWEEQLITFQKIISLKEGYPDKVICLIGNHCIQYMRKYNPSLKEICKGYQKSNVFKIADLFDKYSHLFQMAANITIKNNYYLFTHAGVTNEFYQYLLQIADYPDLDISFLINEVWVDYFKEPDFNSHLWVRPSKLRLDPLMYDHSKNLQIIQIVGHTPLDNMLIDLNKNIYFTDSNQNKPIYFII